MKQSTGRGAAGTRISQTVVITRRQRGLVEIVLSVLIWSVLVGLAAGSYGFYVERAHVSDVLFHAITIKQDMTGFRAESGHWPLAGPMPGGDWDDERTITKVEYEEGGGFTFFISRNGETNRVSFRAAISESSPRAPVIWLCGYAAPPAGLRITARNRTDIPSGYLPASCRGDT